MDLEALRNATFSKLGEAITDWSEMVDKLTKLEEQASKQLAGKARKADWAGYNATVTREFITKTSKEFGDAVTQATSVRNILRDTRNELVTYRDNLRDAITQARDKQQISVIGTGNGRFIVSSLCTTEGKEPTEGEMKAVRDEVQRILDKATRSDETASDALRALADQSKYGFANAAYEDRDAAAHALKAAEKAAKLAKNPKDLSPKEFDELNHALEKYADDGLFAERFATELGAQGTAEFWANLNSSNINPQLGYARGGQFDDLQKNLSLTLAEATQSDSPAMQRWEKNMVKLGPDPFPSASGTTQGFQVMSSLMRFGDYDDKFLNRYGNELINYEKTMTDNGTAADRLWETPGAFPSLNYAGPDRGVDPMTGFMKALAHSPEASTEFFNDQYVTKNEDHGFRNDEGNKVSVSNFEYLFEHRAWPTDGEHDIAGRNFLAKALESATTGHTAGTPPSVEHIPHTEAQAELYESIVESVSEDKSRLLDHGYMSDSFGQITAEYMPDIHRSLDPAVTNENTLYPVSNAAAELSETDVTRFLYTLGRNPEGYAAVNIGQNSYTAALMESHFNHTNSFTADPNFTDSQNLNKAIGHIAERAGEIQGTLAAGRAYEAEMNGAARDAEYNQSLTTLNTWGSTVAGIAIGVASAPFIGPGSIAAGAVASTAANEIIDSITGSMQQDSTGEVLFHNGVQWEGTRQSTYETVERAAAEAGEASGNPSPFIVATAAEKAEEGFNNARTNIHESIDGEGIPRSLDGAK